MKSREDDTVIKIKQPFKSIFSRIVNATNQEKKMYINLAVIILLVTILAISHDRFLTLVNITNVMRQISAVIVTGSAVTLLMIAGCLDLSVGGVLALSGVTGALLSKVMPLPLAFLLAICVGTFVGMINGILFTRIKVNAFIATLSTMFICRGIAMLITGGIDVIQLPRGYSFLGSEFFLRIPIPVWSAIAAVTIYTILERYTLVGRYAVASGSNKKAAYLSGVQVNKVHMLLYTLSGTMAGVAGVFLSSRLRTGVPTVGIGFEFEVIVAIILGGTTLMGGEGSVIGMVLGAIIVGFIGNGLNLLGISSFVQLVVLGVVLILAVSLDLLMRRKRVGVS